MRKIYFKVNAGYCGMDDEAVVEFPDDVTDDELNTYCDEMAWQNYEMYSPDDDCPYGDYCEDDECQLNHMINVDGFWEDCDPEKHG